MPCGPNQAYHVDTSPPALPPPQASLYLISAIPCSHIQPQSPLCCSPRFLLLCLCSCTALTPGVKAGNISQRGRWGAWRLRLLLQSELWGGSDGQVRTCGPHINPRRPHEAHGPPVEQPYRKGLNLWTVASTSGITLSVNVFAKPRPWKMLCFLQGWKSCL